MADFEPNTLPTDIKFILLDSLEECGLDEYTVGELQRAMTSEAAAAHMVGQLPIPYLVAMSVIGNAARKNMVVHNTMFGLAELCRVTPRIEVC